jgi:hypothetical protein
MQANATLRRGIEVLILLLLFAWPGAPSAHAQTAPPNFLWAYRAGWTNYDLAQAITVDATGSCYVTGAFEESAYFGSTLFKGAGSRDLFLAKYDANGKFLWAQTAGGTNYDLGTALAVDKQNNVYVAGAFSGAAKFGSVTLTSAGGRDAFLAKYDPNGRIQWAVRGGGRAEDCAHGVAVDPEGNVVITGYFEDTAGFGASRLVSAGYDDIFAVMYRPDGEVRWANRVGGGMTDFGRAVAIDPGGYVYITGSFYGQAEFGKTKLTSRGSSDIFVMKLDNGGSVDWAYQYGGPHEDRGYGIAVTPAGQVYVTGSFVGPGTFGKTNVLAGQGLRDIFLTRLDSEGKFYWAREAGGKLNDEALAIALDPTGSAYVTGFFRNTATFGRTQLKSLGAPQWIEKELFIAKWDDKGVPQWARSGGGRGTDIGYGIAVDPLGRACVTGNFSGDAWFAKINLGGQAMGSIFILRMAGK